MQIILKACDCGQIADISGVRCADGELLAYQRLSPFIYIPDSPNFSQQSHWQMFSFLLHIYWRTKQHLWTPLWETPKLEVLWWSSSSDEAQSPFKQLPPPSLQPPCPPRHHLAQEFDLQDFFARYFRGRNLPLPTLASPPEPLKTKTKTTYLHHLAIRPHH